MRKQIVIAAFALLAGTVGVSFAQSSSSSPTMASLDVIVRDFQPNHPDFENFSQERLRSYNGTLAGTGDYKNTFTTWGTYPDYGLWSAVAGSCATMDNPAGGIAIGTDSLPVGVASPALPAYLQKTSATGVILEYGECNGTINGKLWRGHTTDPACGSFAWSEGVYITPGMVNTNLTFTAGSNGSIDFYSPTITKSASYGYGCDNTYFDQWFSDVEGINRKSSTTLDIPATATTGFYEIDYNWNNGGYFPLDVVSGELWAGSQSGTYQFGPQSLSIFCPPFNYPYANKQADKDSENTFALCSSWLANGGPRSIGGNDFTTSAAYLAAAGQGNLGLKHLRNYNFTMMGYAKFKYHADRNLTEALAEVFEFAGDDDMWIFVDGVLAVDLGGTHLAAPGKVNLYTLAQNCHGCFGPLAGTSSAIEYETSAVTGLPVWKDGSWHHLHFFYADRQTDGSNMRIRSSLSELAPTIYGQPRIMHAEVKTDDKGNLVTYLFLNTTLSSPSVDLIKSSGGTGYFPILVTRSLKDTVSLAYKIDTLAYYVTGLTYVNNQGADGVVYKLEGQLCSDVSCSTLKNPALNDSLAFNYSATTDGYVGFNRFTYSNASVSITSAAGKAVVSYEWGPVTKISIGSVTTIVPTDNTIDRPPFDNKTLPSGELPNDQTGEIVISPLPSDYANDPEEWLKNNLGPWTSTPVGTGSGFVSGSTASDANGRFTFLQSSTTDASNSSGGVTRCYNDGKEESCTSIAFVTDEPFQINVRVFDNLGHFVSQYTESMSEAALKQIVATNSTGVQERCYNMATGFEGNGVTSGSVIATVKMYPVSQNGRKISTGPYIYQVSLIEYPFEHCVNLGGQTYLPGEYRRTQFSMTRGYRRVELK